MKKGKIINPEDKKVPYSTSFSLKNIIFLQAMKNQGINVNKQLNSIVDSWRAKQNEEMETQDTTCLKCGAVYSSKLGNCPGCADNEKLSNLLNSKVIEKAKGELDV